MIQEKVRQRILEKAISLEQLGIRDIAWKRHDAIDLIKSLMEENIAIPGGDVYRIQFEKPTPSYDSWSCEQTDKETREEYSLRSKLRSLDYIEKYPKTDRDDILFSLVFDEYFDSSLDGGTEERLLEVADGLAAENLAWLVNWYTKECGDQCGHLQISVEGGPSWSLSIDIQKTRLAGKVFSETTTERSKESWVCCFIKDGVFQGYGGPKNLPELLQIFHRWATESE